ncbi:MAG: PD-(D/E)XK nuclease-like domain-containing protein, partial [Deltaproteobacteria bacterium]|nr:PD-(D/E)XK nuclease-like domain-containing protein [Deltaproteobacteria bacterium]
KLSIYPAKARIKTPDTAIFAFGRAFHVYVLEPDTFEKAVAISPEINRRTNQGKEDYRMFVEQNKDKTVITADEFNTIKGMKEKILLHPLASKLIEGGLSEQTVIWTDEETGLPCKARPDKIPTVDGVVVDLKKTRDASPHGFQRSLIEGTGLFYLYSRGG